MITCCYHRLIDDPDTAELNCLSMEEREHRLNKLKDERVGNVRLIGELFMHGLLTESVIHVCLNLMLDDTDNPDEDDIENMSELLRTVGKALEERSASTVNGYFKQIDHIIDSGNLSSRLRFMLKDVVDLRRNKWVARRAKVVDPKTLDQVRRDASSPSRPTVATKKSNKALANPDRRIQMAQSTMDEFYSTGDMEEAVTSMKEIAQWETIEIVEVIVTSGFSRQVRLG